jgi:chemotaxis protein histidine kinase CheA
VGLIAADKPLEEEELARLILLPGFSTRGVATQTSGRGIGMDMVYSRLLDMKGSLRYPDPIGGQGCLMELRLPVTLISTHALLVRMHDGCTPSPTVASNRFCTLALARSRSWAKR